MEHEPRPRHRSRQEQPPRVRVEQQSEPDAQPHHVLALAAHEGEDEARRREDREQHDQRVHARLLRVVREERRPRRARRGQRPRALVEHPRARPERGGNGKQREDQAERAGRRLARPRHPHPPVQQQVVQRRVAVLAEHPRDVGEVVRGDPDRDPLVDPVPRVQRAGAQQQRRTRQEREGGGDQDRFAAGQTSVHGRVSVPRAWGSAPRRQQLLSGHRIDDVEGRHGLRLGLAEADVDPLARARPHERSGEQLGLGGVRPRPREIERSER